MSENECTLKVATSDNDNFGSETCVVLPKINGFNRYWSHFPGCTPNTWSSNGYNNIDSLILGKYNQLMNYCDSVTNVVGTLKEDLQAYDSDYGDFGIKLKAK